MTQSNDGTPCDFRVVKEISHSLKHGSRRKSHTRPQMSRIGYARVSTIDQDMHYRLLRSPLLGAASSGRRRPAALPPMGAQSSPLFWPSCRRAMC
jgi:hypothetical protein